MGGRELCDDLIWLLAVDGFRATNFKTTGIAVVANHYGCIYVIAEVLALGSIVGFKDKSMWLLC